MDRQETPKQEYTNTNPHIKIGDKVQFNKYNQGSDIMIVDKITRIVDRVPWGHSVAFDISYRFEGHHPDDNSPKSFVYDGTKNYSKFKKLT